MSEKPAVNETESNPERINQHSRVVAFSDTELGGGNSGIVFDKAGCDRVSFDDPDHRHKYVAHPTKGSPGVLIVATESGNQYILGDGMVINSKTGKAYVMPAGYALPDIEFGKPWGVDGVFKTSPVGAMIAEYRIGDVPADARLDMESPFPTARRALEAKRQKIDEAKLSG